MAKIDVITMDDLWKENINGYFPFLLEIYNPDIVWDDVNKNTYGQKDCYLRLICDETSVVYKGERYLPCAFSFAMPETDGTKIGNASISISALDYRVRKLLNSIRIPSEVKVVAMFAKANKENEEDGFIFKFKELESYTFRMEMAECNRTVAKFTLLAQQRLDGDTPYDVATPDRVPATKG